MGFNSAFKGLKMGPIVCPETSVRNCRCVTLQKGAYFSWMLFIFKWKRVRNTLHVPDGMSHGSHNHERTFSLYWFLILLGFLRFFVVCGLDLSWGSFNLDRFRSIPFTLFYNLVGFGYFLVCFWVALVPFGLISS
jgi:hypothetical protein